MAIWLALGLESSLVMDIHTHFERLHSTLFNSNQEPRKKRTHTLNKECEKAKVCKHDREVVIMR